MTIPNSFWEDKNGRWTIASNLVSTLCWADYYKELKPDEVYYILDTLDIKERFTSYWDRPEFYQRVGMAHLAINKANKHGRFSYTQQGDFAWAAGDVNAAECFYEESIKKGSHHDCWSGYGGKFRLHFFRKQLEECIKIFRKICPPHSFYLEYNLISKRYLNDRDGIVFNKSTDSLGEKYKETSPFFISNGKYMLKTVVFAAINTGFINDKLREMISDYFEVSEIQINELAKSLRGNEKEFIRLKKYIEPKQLKTDNTIDNLIKNGATDKAKKLCEKVLNHEQIIAETEKAIIRFLQSGDEAILDEIVIFNPPFGITEADRIIFDTVLESITKQINQNPERQLVLMRKFGPLCSYPQGKRYLIDGKLVEVNGFVDVYRNMMLNTNYKVLPSDILLCIKKISWYKETVFADSFFVSQNFEWCNAMLGNYVDSLGHEFLRDKDETIQTIYEAYKYLRERYEDAQNKQTWVSEELLAEAIKSLFGKDNVTQHASPIWLSPQHLDIYLPSYNLAIEYMGKQHYEPVDYFGGEKAFKDNQERDKRKAELCTRMKINLVYVTHEEDVGKRAKEIFELYGK